MTDEQRIELLAALVQRKWRDVKNEANTAFARRSRPSAAQQELAAAQLLLQIAQEKHAAETAKRPYMRPAIVAELEWKA